MGDEERKEVDFDRLNPVGKVVFLTGSAARLLANTVDFAVRTASTVFDEASRAFREGLEEDESAVSDAHVVRESDERSD